MAVNHLSGTTGLPASAATQYCQEFTASDLNYGGTWTQRTGPATPTAGNWWGVAYGAGVYVMVGNGNSLGQIAYSSDGITWTRATSGVPSTNVALYAVTYANSRFVVVGNGVCYTSTDGIAWTSRTIAAGAYQYITYHNSLFITSNGGGSTSTNVMTSPDGITWTSRTMPATVIWSGLATNGTTAVAVSGGYKTTTTGLGTAGTQGASSTDGTTWTSRTMPSSQAWSGVAYGNGTFVAVALNPTGLGQMVWATSTNGTTWTALANTLTVGDRQWGFNNIQFVNGRFIVLPIYGKHGMYSTDGSTWTPFAFPNIQQSGTTTTLPVWMDVVDNGSGQGVAVGGWNNIPILATTAAVSAQTWTCPAGVTKVQALAVGGGGGGGSANVSCAGGGGGGEVLLRVLPVVPGVTYAISVGAMGRGFGGLTINGGAGGATTMTSGGNTLISAGGGGGGAATGNPVAAVGSTGGSAGTTNTQAGGGGGGAGGAGYHATYLGSAWTGVSPIVASTGTGSAGGVGMNTASGSSSGGNGGPGMYGFGGGGGGAGTARATGVGACGAGRGADGGSSVYSGTSAQPNSGSGGGGSRGDGSTASLGYPGHGGSGYLRLDWWA